MSKKIGITTGLFQELYGEKQALRIAKQCGADCVDFSIFEEFYDCTKPDNIYSKSDEEILK